MRRRRFDAVELLLVVVMVALVSMAAGGRLAVPNAMGSYGELQAHMDAQALRARFGPNHYSEHLEEWIIRVSNSAIELTPLSDPRVGC